MIYTNKISLYSYDSTQRKINLIVEIKPYENYLFSDIEISQEGSALLALAGNKLYIYKTIAPQTPTII